MAGNPPLATPKFSDCFVLTTDQCLSPEDQNISNSSTISWASESPTIDPQDLDLDFVSELFSNTSTITTPVTSIESDPDLPSAKVSHKRKHLCKVEEPITEEDFGTFEDWLRWDEPESQSTTTSMSRDNAHLNQADDSIVFVEDAISDSPLFPPRNFNPQPSINTRINSTSSSFDNLNLVGIPPRATIYNSPPQLPSSLTWPQQQQTPQTQQYSQQPLYYSSALSPQEEARLRSIAMPQLNQGSAFSSTNYYPSHSALEHGHVPQRPKLSSHSSSQKSVRRKRKPTGDTNADQFEVEDDLIVEEPSPISTTPTTGNFPAATKGKKTSHNMIEKRYRNNLNDKIAELRDSVPSLRVMSKHSNPNGSDDEDEEEDLEGLSPAHRLNKATILSKATEYINHLERRNDHLTKENAALKARVDAFEILMMSRQQPPPLPPPQQHYHFPTHPQQHQQHQQQHHQHQHQQQQHQQHPDYASRGWMG